MGKIFIGFILVLLFASNIYALGTGDSAPSFTVKDLKGTEITLNDILKEKGAVIVFWTTWCPSCKREIPFVESFYEEYGSDVGVLGVNVGETRVKVEDLVEKKRISYPIALDFKKNVSKKYAVVGVPTIVAIGKDGNITYYGHSVDEMKEKVEF